VPTAHAEIEDFGNRRTLIVERFDWRWTHDGRLLRLPIRNAKSNDYPSNIAS
jgi:serine/threonine-protein kinase HipA